MLIEYKTAVDEPGVEDLVIDKTGVDNQDDNKPGGIACTPSDSYTMRQAN